MTKTTTAKVGTKVVGGLRSSGKCVLTVASIGEPDSHGDRVVTFDDGSAMPLWVLESGSFLMAEELGR